MKKKIFLLILIVLFSRVLIQPGYSLTQEKISVADVREAQKKLDIVLVLDNSGSMQKNDPEFLTQNVVSNFMIGFGKKHRLGMIIFDQDARLVEPLNNIDEQLAKAKFLKSLEKVNYKGRLTNTPSAIERAIYELKMQGRPDARKIIILLTDGIVDTGDKRKDIEKGKWLKDGLTWESKRMGINIFGIAFTENADFSLIQTLAIKTDGEYFRAYKPEDIQTIFNKINEVLTKQPGRSKTPSPLTGESVAGITPPMEPVMPETTVKKAGRSPHSETIKHAVPNKTLTIKPPVLQPEAVETTGASTPKTSYAWKEGLFLPIILAGIFVLLGVIIIIMVFNRKSGAIIYEGADHSTPELDPKKSIPIPSAKLIDVKNITGEKPLILDKRIIKIGRNSNNDVAIPINTVSSFHAIIEYRDGFFYIEDQRSKNKTYLNGEEIVQYSPRKLKSGDEIMFNIYKFKFILPDLIPSGETVIDFRRKSDNVPGSSPVVNTPDIDSQNICPIPQAMLIDDENITGKKTFILKKTKIKIGRSGNNDFEIPQNSVSGLHATIEFKDASFYIEDQKSINKTYINGEEIEPYSPNRLKSGDEILFDVFKFIFLQEGQLPTGDTGKRL